jgi:CRISPR-associated protein (TIGR02710 family)
MTKAMIVSVGGSPEPIIIALREQQPEFVCFFASQQSIDEVAGIKQGADFSGTDAKELVENKEDLVQCYRTALRCIDRVRARGIALDETVVDYTSGTKPMSAALAMAAASHGVRFSYVGGTRRTKGGLGIVESGSEQRRMDHNPWQLFAVEEKRRVAQYFNSHQYAAAAAALTALVPRLLEPDRSLLEALTEVTEGYAVWDRFDHRAAWRRLGEARKKLAERVRFADQRHYDELLAALNAHVEFLTSLRENTDHFRRSHLQVVGDLVANAERRIEEEKFDDAVARLYRAVELRGQVAFESAIGTSTSKVAPAQLPETLRDEYQARYGDRGSELLRLPLFATYRVLDVIGDPTGVIFRDQRKNLDELLEARNTSILAHGLRPLSADRAQRMLDVARRFLPSDLELPRFPRLPW